MKHPLAFSIATIGVIAVMIMAVMMGAIRLGPAPKPEHFFHIENVVTYCPRGALEDVPAETRLPTLGTLKASCDQQPVCDIDTVALLSLDENPACTQEWKVTYYCVKDSASIDISKHKPRYAYLYEGQQATLHCTTP